MKKIVLVLVAGALVFSLAACGKKEEAPAPVPAASPAPAAPMGGMTSHAAPAAPAK